MKFIYKKILECSIFVLIFLILLGLLSPYFPPLYTHLATGRMCASFSGIYAEASDSIDVLLMGNSESVYAFSPSEMWEKYGIASYHGSSPSQEVYQDYEYLKIILETQHPTALVIETEQLAWELSLDNLLRSIMRMSSPVFANHDQWQKVVPLDFQDKNWRRYADDIKGQQLNYGIDVPEPDQYMFETDEKEKLPLLNLILFDRIIELCTEEQISVLLVSAPSAFNWSMDRHNAMVALAERYHLPYLDMNTCTKEMGLDWSRHTWDKGDHLNCEGARVASSYLGKWIKEQISLPDRRKDPAYSSWNESLEAYHALISQNKRISYTHYREVRPQ